MKRLRRALLELWAILPTAAIVGFLGPFGTYLRGDYLQRVAQWWLLLMGAYVLARPALLFWQWVARATMLPRRSLTFWGVVFSSAPIAAVWNAFSPEGLQGLKGYVGVLPFALLCSLLVMVIAGWAERADAYLLANYPGTIPGDGGLDAPPPPAAPSAVPAVARTNRPRLFARLSPGFEAPILALESEDHYVRVHGARRSELILLRLRDAIAEMDDTPGEQTHRSWWVARAAVAGVSGSGRAFTVLLTDGNRAPVARDSIGRLERSGFLPRRSAGA